MIYSDFEVQTRDVEIFVFFSFILDSPVSWKCFIFLRDKILFNWKVFLPFEVYKIKQTVKFAMSFVIALNENKWCNESIFIRSLLLNDVYRNNLKKTFDEVFSRKFSSLLQPQRLLV